MAAPRILNGKPGERWINNTGKVRFQAIVAWHNSCGRCIQNDHAISTSKWPFPLHRFCSCKQIPIYPGKESLPFVDFREELDRLPAHRREHVVGKAALKLVDAHVLRWPDVVTATRVKSLHELVARHKLTVERMTKAGVDRRTAQLAYDRAHGHEAEALAEQQRQAREAAVAAKAEQQRQAREATQKRLAEREAKLEGQAKVPKPVATAAEAGSARVLATYLRRGKVKISTIEKVVGDRFGKINAEAEAARLRAEEARRKAEESASRKAEREAARKAKEETKARLAAEKAAAEKAAAEKAAAEAKAKAKAEQEAKVEAARKAAEEADRKKAEAARLLAEAKAKAKAEAERKARAEAEAHARAEAARKQAEAAKAEEAARVAAAQAKAEAERKAQAQAEAAKLAVQSKAGSATIDAGRMHDLVRERTAGLTKPSQINRAVHDLLHEQGFGAAPTVRVRAPGTAHEEDYHVAEVGGMAIHYPPLPKEFDPQKPHPLAMMARTVWGAEPLPEGLTRHVKDVYISTQTNDREEEWKRKYNQPGGEVAATGASGRVTTYKGQWPGRDAFAHELGHNLASGTFGAVTPPPGSAFHAAIASGEPPVSAYGKVNAAEDFAEAARLHATDPAEMERIAPRRAAALRELIGAPGTKPAPVATLAPPKPPAPPTPTPPAPKPAATPAAVAEPVPPSAPWKPKPQAEFQEIKDPKKIEAWGEANYRDWADGLSNYERPALKQYAGENYKWMNGLLRGSTEELHKLAPMLSEAEAMKTVGHIDAALQKGKTDRDLVMFRGIQDARKLGFDLATAQSGDEMTMQGFFSATMKEDIALDFATKHDVNEHTIVFKVNMPQGSTGAYLNAAEATGYAHEREFLMPSDTKYRFVRQGGTIKNRWGQEVRVIVLERVE